MTEKTDEEIDNMSQKEFEKILNEINKLDTKKND